MSRVTRSVLAGLALTSGLATGLAPMTATAAPTKEQDPEVCDGERPRLIDSAGDSTAMDRLQVSRARRLSTGRGVRVAVVDSGVHDNVHFTSQTLTYGWSARELFSTGKKDVLGQGTAVAGIVAARRYPGSAVEGVATDAEIWPYRAYDVQRRDQLWTGHVRKRLSTAGIARAIWQAARARLEVIVVPVALEQDEDTWQLRKAVRYALSENSVVIAAAGDNRPDSVTMPKPDSTPRYPAALPGVIAVAATDSNGHVDNHSVHGSWVDVAAPGQNLLTTAGHEDCFVATNTPHTAYAAAFVAGLAAQLRSLHPLESRDMIAYRIESYAQRDDPTRPTPEAGWGEIRPYDSLENVPDPTRRGPVYPGTKAHSAGPGRLWLDQGRGPVSREERMREQGYWLAIGGVGLSGLVLLLRPVIRRRRA